MNEGNKGSQGDRKGRLEGKFHWNGGQRLLTRSSLQELLGIRNMML